MTLGILLVSVQTYFQLRFTYRDTNKLRLSVPKDVQSKSPPAASDMAARGNVHCSQDEHIVRQALERGPQAAEAAGRDQRDTTKSLSERDFPKHIELKGKYKIRDKPLLLKASLSIAFAVTLFFLHSLPELQTLSLGWTALLGAVLVLILADREDLEPILHRVEWSTLMFFAALFVLMEALSKLALIESIGGVTESIIMSVDESNRLMVALMLLVWVSGVTSAFVDNVPLTTMMVRVVTSLGTNPDLGLPMGPLVWALSFGVCLGGLYSGLGFANDVFVTSSLTTYSSPVRRRGFRHQFDDDVFVTSSTTTFSSPVRRRRFRHQFDGDVFIAGSMTTSLSPVRRRRPTPMAEHILRGTQRAVELDSLVDPPVIRVEPGTF
ncbi:P protein [Eumeta japonica]|uniref:P protein n=1 Tax=Eumeta variegata TaxID=151549 RepID=A0A4C2AFY2_EUMVA|nr:P protein [Eumeta japonica]